MFRNDKLANAVRLAMMFGAVSTAALSTSVMAAEEEEDQAKKVERIEVTGSRIKRTDMEGALPVSTIDRVDIDMSGQISVSDLLRGTTFNTSGSTRPQSGSSAQGVSTVNLRGLGADRTLVLVDGRRLPKSPSTGQSQDLNTIPIGAVERVEILSDGASALYGSDAMGGVVNIITRKDFNGAELTIGAGKPSVPEEGGDRENGSFAFGSSSGTTSVLGGVSWNSQDIVFERDYPWTTSGASRYGNNWEDETGNLFGIPNGCDEPGFVKNATGTCGYNFNAVNATEASTKNKSLFVKANHQINDEWSVFMNSSAAKTDSFGRYAPVPDYFEISKDSVNNPTNPNSWFYDAKNPKRAVYDAAKVGPARTVGLNHRFAALGPRDGYTTNDTVDFLAGSTAQLEGVDLDFGVRRTASKSYDIGYNYVVRNTAQMFLENGSYNIQEPGKNPAEVLGSMTATIARVSTSDQDEVFANASFDMFEMPAGMVQGVVGAEYRKEDYTDRYDSLSENGQIGGSAGNSAGGDRSVKSAFFESLVPVLDNLELSFAGRYDKYSDYGSDFAPKVSTKWIPIEDMVVRASWGQGFRAPTLDILTAKTTFAAAEVTDQPTCSLIGADKCQVDAFIQSNPNLQSEQSDQYSFGWAWQPMDWINFSVDYWNIKIDNRITYFSPEVLISRIRANESFPAGLGVVRKPNGAIDRVNAGYGNEGVVNTDGVDINVQTNFDFGDLGRLNQNLQIARTLSYDNGGRDFVKDPGTPAHRLTLQNIYSFGDFDFGYNLNLIGNQYRCGVGEASNNATVKTRNGCSSKPGADRSGNWGTYVTHDMQVTYSTPWQGKVTLGALNMFEKIPSLRPINNREYNFDLYDGWGRVAYVRYTQSF